MARPQRQRGRENPAWSTPGAAVATRAAGATRTAGANHMVGMLPRLAAGTAIGLALALILRPLPAVAANSTGPLHKLNTKAPVLLRADEVIYDRDQQIATARGHVEMSQAGQVLHADIVVYNQRTDTVEATGHVSLTEPTGNVLFGDYMELTDQLHDGFIRGVGALLVDNSRAAGANAIRTDGNKTVITDAIYSPCDLCVDDKTKAPLWQLRATQVIHDETTHLIEYKNAVLDAYGIPVLYTPYFSHYDPTIKRASGFLVPSIGHDSTLGIVTSIPYYYVVSPSADVTVTPEYTSSRGPVLNALYRQRTDDGQFRLGGSITQSDVPIADVTNATASGPDKIRGEIEGAGRFNLDDGWRWGFDVQRATDQTYMLLYRISTEDQLTSDAFIENFHDRSYFNVSSYAFQGLLTGDQNRLTPYVLPSIDYHYVGQPSALGGYYTVDSSALSIFRTEGTDTRRLSTTFGWTNNYIAPAGDTYSLHAEMRGDYYSVTGGSDQFGDISPSGNYVRPLPLVALTWRYPFVRSQGSIQELVEPIVMAVASPYGGNNTLIPDEDSRDFELTDANLFAYDRFPGLDRYESGPRVAYGLHAAAYGLSGGYTDFLFGESIRTRTDSSLPIESGLQNKFSDFVGHLTIAPSPLFEATDNFRLNYSTLSPADNEITATMGPSFFRVSLLYSQLASNIAAEDLGPTHEYGIYTTMQLSRHWQISGGYVQDQIEPEGEVNTSLALHYIDECFDIIFSFNQNNIEIQDVRPSTSFKISFRLKNLG